MPAEHVGITETNLFLLKQCPVKGMHFETLQHVRDHRDCQTGDLLRRERGS